LYARIKYIERRGNREWLASRNTWWDQRLVYSMLSGEELLTKRGKADLFILLKQDVGLAKLMEVSCLFAQKRKGLHGLSSRECEGECLSCCGAVGVFHLAFH